MRLIRSIGAFFGVFQYSGRGLELVWRTSHALTLSLAGLTVIAGALPAAVAWLGKLIVDAVVLAAQTGAEADAERAITYVLIEGAVVQAVAAVQRGLTVCQSLLRAQLGHRVNVTILEKALELELEQFEDAELISHRFSTVRRADHIVVLREGRVIDEGDHDALMTRDGIYARLFSLQAQGYR